MASEDAHGARPANKFSTDELKVMENIFNNFDNDNKGYIPLSSLPALLESLSISKG